MIKILMIGHGSSHFELAATIDLSPKVPLYFAGALGLRLYLN